LNPNYSRYLPGGIAAGLGAIFMLAMMMPPRDPPEQMHLAEAARLPVVEGGRVMPLDTVARNRLMIISGRQEFVDDKGNRQPAIKWLLDVMATWLRNVMAAHGDDGAAFQDPGPDFQHKVFRIENDQVLGLLNLQPRSGFRYSLAEILPRFKEFDQQYEQVRNVAVKDRGVYENKVFELAEHLHLYQELRAMEVPRVIPPLAAGEEWRTLPDGLQQDIHQGRRDSATKDFATILNAHMKDDVKGFNAALAAYQKLIDKQLPQESSKTDFEAFFNHFAPFYQCAVLYVFVLVLACAGWVAFPQQFNQAAFALAGLTLVVHTFALFGRMYLMGRPLVFVTNLYSSAVFIGWISVILGLVLERIYRNGLGNFVAAVIGALTLVIGHYLATTGDTLEMMQAVLDTNFWLATHVTSVTIGYSATFVAGFLGIVLIGMGVFTTKLNKENYRMLGQMIYGVVCFAMLFSFVGTVLGGIWADQSWGRFWGWDPKENGALLIVLMNALILHARWGGIVQQRGMAVLAVAGNIVTAWSWFGVNMLGVGLHSYGFMSGAVFWLLAFVASQLVVIGIGLVPIQKWPSFAAAARPAMPVPPAPAVTMPVPATAITATPNNAVPGRRKSKRIKA